MTGQLTLAPVSGDVVPEPRTRTHDAAVTAKALLRLTPHMALHQAKRHVRNRVVPLAPGAYAQRITWRESRTPLVDIRRRAGLRHGELARLLAAFYASSPDTVADALRGTFTFYGERVAFGSLDAVDWTHRLPTERDHHMWRMKLAQGEVLHSMVADPALGPSASGFYRRLTDAVELGSPAAFSTVWGPYTVSHRLLAVLSGLLLLPDGVHDEQWVAEVCAMARWDAAFLWCNVEHDLRNNHTERNLAALCLYHDLAGASPRDARRLSRMVRNIVRATILPDGTQVERSAMYQGLSVAALAIFASSSVLAPSVRRFARERSDAARCAWSLLTHADGGIALFNDSWLGETPSPAEVLGAPTPVRDGDLPDGGYRRLTTGPLSVIADIGPIGPRWNPGHGHSDFLSVELDVHRLRFVVDPGTSQYSTGPRRTFERSAAAHNGPRYRGVEPVDYTGCFKVGALARPERVPGVREADRVAVGSLRTRRGRVARAVVPSTGSLVVADAWQHPRHPGAVTLHVPATWEVSAHDGTSVIFVSEGTTAVVTVLVGRIAGIAAGAWSRAYHRAEPAHVLSLVPAVNETQDLVFVVSARSPDEVRAAEVDRAVRLAHRGAAAANRSVELVLRAAMTRHAAVTLTTRGRES